MQCAYCLLWPALFYNIFPHCLINGTIFGKKKVIEHKPRVLISSTNFVWNISHLRRIECDMIKNVYWSSCKVIVIHDRFEWNLIFLSSFFFENTQISNFMKIRSSGSDVVPTGQRDGRTDIHDEACNRFRNFANAPKRSGLGTLNRVLYKVVFLQVFLWCLMMACSSSRNVSHNTK